MLTDYEKQIIEHAAIMNGFQVKGWVGDKLNYYDPILNHEVFGDWNPLDDFSDALKLAIKLQITICNEQLNSGQVCCTIGDEVLGVVFSKSDKDYLVDDDYRDTLTSITKAASELYLKYGVTR